MSSKRPKAVVIGLDNLVGIPTARILAARGVPVIGVGHPSHPFCKTRVCERILSFETKGKGLIDALVELLEGFVQSQQIHRLLST